MQFDVEVSSRYLPWVGIHASQSNFRRALRPRSPAATSITWKASSSLVRNSFSQASNRWCSASASSTGTNENISTLSNQCTRMIPVVSLPYEPASRR